MGPQPDTTMSAERRQLVDRTEGHMSTLKEALCAIEATKQSLKDNSAEVKSQIHTVVSRQLESLRNREVWLLGQVDVLEDAKEAILQAQEVRLHHALGELTNSLEYSQVDDDDGLHITSKLTRSLDRLNELELRPLESAHISFQADVSGMRCVIHDFGYINSRGPAQDVGFFVTAPASTCLPHTFEDYGDAEHHVLYKTLEDVKRERQQDDSSVSIKVEIPRLVRPMAEWLAWTPGTTPTPTPTSSKGGHFTFPPFTAGGAAVGSIRQWLADIKRETEVEEEDFEVISGSGARPVSESSSMEVLHASEATEGHTTVHFPYFEHVHATPHSDWLLMTGADGEDSMAIQRSTEKLAYFKEVMETNEKWLADFTNQATQADESEVDKTAHCDGVCGPSTENPHVIDIENLVDILPCIDVIDYPVFTEVQQSSSDLWLLPPGSDDEKDVDEVMDGIQGHEKDEVMDGIQGLCRANEVCHSFSNCLSDENCNAASIRHATAQQSPTNAELGTTERCGKSLQENVQSWLSQLKNSTIMEELNESPLFAYFRTLPSVNDYWLASPSNKETSDAGQPQPGNADLFPVFTSRLTISAWLPAESAVASSDSPTHDCMNRVPYHPQMEAISNSADCNWLHSEGSSAMECSTPNEANLTHYKYRCNPIAEERQKWLCGRDPQFDTNIEESSPPCPTMLGMPTIFFDHKGSNINLWLSPLSNQTNSPSSPQDPIASPANLQQSPLISITKPSPDTTTSTTNTPANLGTTIPPTPRSHPPLVRNTVQGYQNDNKIWLQKKSLSVEEDDLDVPLMSETVAASVSSVFAKMGLGHGPWLREGDNYFSPADKIDDDEEEEEDDACWLMKKESTSLEKHSPFGLKIKKAGSGDLFACFHEKANNNISTWLSKANLED